jgi:hypothetical protein
LKFRRPGAAVRDGGGGAVREEEVHSRHVAAPARVGEDLGVETGGGGEQDVDVVREGMGDAVQLHPARKKFPYTPDTLMSEG